MSSAALAFDILARDRASSTFDKVGKSSETMGSKLKSAGKFAAVGLAAVGAGAVAAGAYVFNYAAKLEQMEAKAATVFGGQLSMVEKWAKVNSHAMGLTSREATGLAANFADLLIPMGFSRNEAAKMSTKVVGLAGALSQWSGGTKSAAEVTEILNAAMLGETDGLKALGISISAADVQAQLLKNGQDKLTGAAKQQAEAQAIQSLIFAKSTDAQDAFAKGGSPLLSAQMKLKATFGEIRDTLIAKLIPALSDMASWFVAKGLPAISKVGKYLADTFGPILGKLVGWIKDKLIPAFMSAYEKYLPALRDAFESVKKSLKNLQPAFDLIGNILVKVLIPAMGLIARTVLPLVAKGIEAVTKVIGFLGDAGIWLWNNVFQPVFKFIVEGIANVLRWFGSMLQKIGKVPGMGWVGDLGDQLVGVADGAQKVADNLKKIPTRKTVTIDLHVNEQSIAGHYGPQIEGLDRRNVVGGGRG